MTVKWQATHPPFRNHREQRSCAHADGDRRTRPADIRHRLSPIVPSMRPRHLPPASLLQADVPRIELQRPAIVRARGPLVAGADLQIAEQAEGDEVVRLQVERIGERGLRAPSRSPSVSSAEACR